MPLEPGTKLGPYEIIAPVNAGSGETYKASDTRLKRSVVIRLLPPEFSSKPELSDQLKRESQTLASLNHPNICAVYDASEHEGLGYVVTENVEGETLAQRLTRGPMELDEALRVAIAIADALDKAHRKGIAHRGLNPSNIMLTATGVKVLDFSLTPAAAAGGPSSSASSLPTRTAMPVLASVPASAAPYVAPEQWEGSRGDARTDIFALGAILYETIAGKPAFEGKTPALLIAAIQTIDPEPLSEVQPLVPPELDYVLKRCFAKNPKQRLQTAWDLMNQLQWISAGGAQTGVPVQLASQRKRRERLVWAALAAAVLVALAMAPAAYWYFQASPSSEVVRFTLPSLGGASPAPVSISPNGRWIVRSPGGVNRGVDSIQLSSATRQLLVTENVVTQPFWSPDSRNLGFFEQGMLKKADIAGGPAQNICEAPAPISGGTWNRDGVILFASQGLIRRVLAAGGQSAPVTALDASKQETEHAQPFFLPDGKHFLYLALSSEPRNSAIYVGSLDSKEQTRVLAADAKAVYAPGYILFSRADAVYAQPFDDRKLVLTGEPIRVADGIANLTTTGPNASASTNRNASFAVSETGIMTFRTGTNTAAAAQTQTGGVADRTVLWIDRSGSRVGQVGGPGAYAGVDISPDGNQVAVHVHEGNGGDSWFFDSAQGRMQRLTFDASQFNASPVWAPDGKRIAFGSRRNGKWGLYVKPADGTAKEELITESDQPKMPMSWSPDGKLLIYWNEDPRTRGDIWMVPVTGDRKPVPILQTQYQELYPQLSSDGKWLAYQSNESGRDEIYIRPFPEGPGKWQISTDGGIAPRWRRDGKELYFVLPPNIMSVDIHVEGSSIKAGVPRVLFALSSTPGPNINGYSYLLYAVSADGQKFLVPQLGAGPAASASGGLADQLITVADQGGATGVGNNGISVIMNWPQLLKRK
jgi:serine/threonine protein kinase/Tol biopolymer transport system component